MTPTPFRRYARKRVDHQCKCGATMSWTRNVCNRCSMTRYIRSRYMSGGVMAQAKVAQARRSGRLRSPSDFPCSDCGGFATEYDHRDYNEPLVVDAVCRGCNVRRGKAVPRRWAPSEWDAYIAHFRADARCRRNWFLEFIDAHDLRPDIYPREQAA